MVFQQDGYARSTMQRIARAAGVSKVTVYAHFRDKAHLFSAVMDQHLANMPTPSLAVPGTSELRLKLACVAEEIRMLAGHPACRFFCQTLVHSSHMRQLYLDQWEARLQRYRRYVVEALAHAHVALPDAHAEQFMRLVLGGHSLPTGTVPPSGDPATITLFERAFSRTSP